MCRAFVRGPLIQDSLSVLAPQAPLSGQDACQASGTLDRIELQLEGVKMLMEPTPTTPRKARHDGAPALIQTSQEAGGRHSRFPSLTHVAAVRCRCSERLLTEFVQAGIGGEDSSGRT